MSANRGAAAAVHITAAQGGVSEVAPSTDLPISSNDLPTTHSGGAPVAVVPNLARGRAPPPYLYRGNGPIRNREFLIWAKGKGGVSPSRAAIFKKCKAV